MLRHILTAMLLLCLGTAYAQNSIKPPPSPFSFDNTSSLPNTAPPLPQIQPAPITGNNIEISSDSILNNIQDEQERQYYAQMIGIENNDHDLINNVSDKVFNTFKEEFADSANKLKPYVLYIFYGLVIFSFLWLLLMQTWHGWSFKEFSVNFTITLFHASIYNLLILNFPNIALYIPNFFAKIGIAVSKVPIHESDILNYGVNYIKAVWHSLSFGQPAVAIMYIVLSVPTFYMILQMIRIYACVLIEGLVIGQLNIIYLAFGGAAKLDSYAKKPFMYLVSIGLRLMFLQIFFGAILGIIAKYATMKISEDVVLVMLISTSLTYWLVNEVVNLVNSFIMGHSNSTNFGSFKTALKDTLLDTYRAVQSMSEAKNLMNKAKEMQLQNDMAKMHDPDFAQRFAPKFNDNSSAASSNNPSQNNVQTSQNTNTQEASFNQNNMQSFNSNSKFDNAQASSSSQNTASSSGGADQETNKEQKNTNTFSSGNDTKSNNSAQSNSSVLNSGLNSIKSTIRSAGTVAKAMLDNNFNEAVRNSPTIVAKQFSGGMDSTQIMCFNY